MSTLTDVALDKGMTDFSDLASKLFDEGVDADSEKILALRKLPAEEAYREVIKVMGDAMKGAIESAVVELEGS